MSELRWLLSVPGPNDRLLTYLGRSRRPAQGSAAKPNVSWSNKLLIFRIYEGQTLDLWMKFVRISETNLWLAGRFCFAPIELFVARLERVRGRSVANWQ
jgi:hypothetical protein